MMYRSVRTAIFGLVVLSTGPSIGHRELAAQNDSGESAALLRVARIVLEGHDAFGELVAAEQWGVVLGKFTGKAENREFRMQLTAGEQYGVVGTADEGASDVDICVFGPEGREVDCDTLLDKAPVVWFEPESSGLYRIVLTVYVTDGNTAYAGMSMWRDGPDGVQTQKPGG